MGLKKTLLTFSCMSVTLACATAAHADPVFQPNEFVTYYQGDWGSNGPASSILTAYFDSVYAAEDDEFIVGVAGTPSEYFIEFTTPAAILAFMPAGGPIEPLTTSYLNPPSTDSGILGGDVVGLALNVDFNNAGFIKGISTVPFGNLVLTNLGGVRGSVNSLDGLTVSQFLMNVAEPCLGGAACPYGLDNVDIVADDLNLAFEQGTPSAWADDHLALPTTPTPEPSSLLLLLTGLGGFGFLQRRRILRI